MRLKINKGWKLLVKDSKKDFLRKIFFTPSIIFKKKVQQLNSLNFIILSLRMSYLKICNVNLLTYY